MEIKKLENLLKCKDLDTLKAKFPVALYRVGDEKFQKKPFVSRNSKQIMEAMTLERSKYYIKRLLKSLTEVKTKAYNDINLNQWQDYTDVETNSLWIMERRDRSGAHVGDYWGNFIPQIPQQLMKRYTKKGDWVLDTFLGSGTTMIEARRMGRHAIGVELQSDVAKQAKARIASEPNPHNVFSEIRVGDGVKKDYKRIMRGIGIDHVQLVVMHPPYWDIIKFSEENSDLSNAKDQKQFLDKFGKLVDQVSPVLQEKRYLAVIISDKYENGEWVPLGFNTMQEVLKRNFRLKSIVVKNFDQTKAKREQESLWRYRALAGGFYIFKHEYVFIFEKT